jgi:putative addiction module component (TIGR02574 family)
MELPDFKGRGYPSHQKRFPLEMNMPTTIEAMGIDRLSVSDRLDLIEQIWDSLPEEVTTEEVPEWHLAELARRRAEAELQPGVGKPWREVLGNFGATS